MKLVYKQQGETPLSAIQRLRKEEGIDEDVPLSYAGRLDPMAEGLLLVLAGEEENQDRGRYLGKDKQYEFEVLFGFGTDTFDILGVVQNDDGCNQDILTEEKVTRVCDSFEGAHKMAYPPYSSKTVDGTPLWKLARHGQIDGIELPTQEVEIYKLELTGRRNMEGTQLREDIIERIQHVSGDFRQEKITAVWKGALMGKGDMHFSILSFDLHCSSGTYVRRIAQVMGGRLNCPALAYTIVRTAVGEHTLDDIPEEYRN